MMNSMNGIIDNDNLVIDLVTRVADLAQRNAENYTKLNMVRDYIYANMHDGKSTYINVKPIMAILGMNCKDALEEEADA